jgi:hypothetical protein
MLLLFAFPMRLAAQDQPKSLLIMGSGNTGTWTTELHIVNPTNKALDIQVGRFPIPVYCTIDPCPNTNAGIPANGEATIQIGELGAGVYMQFLYVMPLNQTDPFPIVRARAYEVAQPARAMELPITSYSALAARNNSPLDFPGAERSSTAHSNLIIAEVSQGYGVTPSARIDAITTDGTTVATKTVTLFQGQNLFLVDVLGTMGIDNFSGHLRVTYTGGGGVIDGALATLTSDGGFAVSAGFNP